MVYLPSQDYPRPVHHQHLTSIQFLTLDLRLITPCLVSSEASDDNVLTLICLPDSDMQQRRQTPSIMARQIAVQW